MWRILGFQEHSSATIPETDLASWLRWDKRHAVLVLDEFQEIVSLDPDLPARMRASFQFQPDVAHVYLGSRQHLLRKVFTDANSPLYNSAKVLPLDPIERDAFSRFIAERFASTSFVITDEAVTRLLDITGGHPHDTQKLAYFTWATAEGDDAPTTPETVERALATAIATDTARYTELRDALTMNQRRLLDAIGQASPSEESCRSLFAGITGWAHTPLRKERLTHWSNADWLNARAAAESYYRMCFSAHGFVKHRRDNVSAVLGSYPPKQCGVR